MFASGNGDNISHDHYAVIISKINNIAEYNNFSATNFCTVYFAPFNFGPPVIYEKLKLPRGTKIKYVHENCVA